MKGSVKKGLVNKPRHICCAVGVVVGILLAPDEGSETRKKLFRGAEDWAGNLKEKLIKSIEETEDLAVGAEKSDKKEFYQNVHSASNPVTGSGLAPAKRRFR